MSSTRIRRVIIVTVLLLLVFTGLYLGLQTLYPVKYSGVITEFSKKYELPEELVYAVIHTESRFRAGAVSPKNASGLMQLSKATADWGAETVGIEDYNYDNVCDPQVNIEIGCWYLKTLLKQFNGELDTALAAYNAGSGNVSRWLSDKNLSADGRLLDSIPFGETRRYVEKVHSAMPVYRTILMIRSAFVS